MVDGVFAGEFDILKGCVVKQNYPTNLQYNEAILSSYMIPDGVHKCEYDISVFRYYFQDMDQLGKVEQFNKAQLKVLLYEFAENNWKPFEEMQNIVKIKIDTKQGLIILENQDQTIHKFKKIIDIHPNLAYKKEGQTFFSINTQQGTQLGLSLQDPDKHLEILEKVFATFSGFTRKERYFFNVVKNKRDQKIKRGLLTRSIAISGEVQMLYVFEEVVKYYLDKYSELPISEEPVVLEEIQAILKDLYKITNEIIDQKLPNNILSISPGMKYKSQNYEKSNRHQEIIDVQYKNIQLKPFDDFYKNLYDVSLINLIHIFEEKTIMIYNAIMKGQKIIFIGYERTIKESIQIACSCGFLVYPLNIYKYIYPYEHLLDLDFVENDFFIASVSNPIFNTRKEWFDLCCDISTGQIIKSNQNTSKQSQNQNLEDVFEGKTQKFDNNFIQEVINQINTQQADEQQVRQMFYNYTRQFISMVFNLDNEIDIDNQEKSIMDAFARKITLFQKGIYYEQVYFIYQIIIIINKDFKIK